MKPSVEYLQGPQKMRSQERKSTSVAKWKTTRRIGEYSADFRGKKFSVLIEAQAPVFDNGSEGTERLSIKLTKPNSYLYLSEEEATFLSKVLRDSLH